MANKIKEIWNAGGAVINGWLAIPNGFSAEIMGQAGWDSVTVDLQHGVQDYMSMIGCFQAMQGAPVVPLVRVPWNEPGIIGKVMDGGAMGVICPMVNTAAEAKAFIDYCSYPPQGHRSNGPIRPGMYTQNYQSTANADTVRIPMIETGEAIENLDAILDVPGVDAVYIGPSDLGFSLGLIPILDREEKQILDIYEQVVSKAAKRGIAAGVHCGSAAYAKRAIGMGFKMVTICSDSIFIAQGAKAALAAVRAK
jgi:4-hydroxy-2-oxoheptanedioate aldolase